jgi:hypothetical protein
LWGIVDSCSKLNSIILKVTNINETYRELLLLLLFSYESERILLKIKQPIQTKRQKSLRTPTKRQASHTSKQAKDLQTRSAAQKQRKENFATSSLQQSKIYIFLRSTEE